ncbi:hypothetical protein G9C98_007776 [Cotesia typhae]|uniref:Uncharacterized protein n=1 Tax=Cotesia typhae TaxID=2053667 RepID=A0A8J5QLF1_9HYME|nr:hypothetical protein G9C98_007776 [Cotesia typhae]
MGVSVTVSYSIASIPARGDVGVTETHNCPIGLRFYVCVLLYSKGYEKDASS